MPEFDNRLLLWRNTIHLFHYHRKVNFVGPFFAAGYKKYRVESPLSELRTGKERKPDIFACGPSGWVVIELTCNDESKKGQLDADKKLDPRGLSNYGCAGYTTTPDTLSSRLAFNNDGGHCQMIVKDIFDIKEDQYVQDSSLRTELIATRGKNLKKLPEIPFSLVPEMKHLEIRRGLIDIVLQIFDPKSPGKTPMQMCEDGLERLFDLTTANTRQSLIDRIKQEMEVLMRGELFGYIEFKDGKYQVTEKFKEYPRTRQVIASKLKEWAQPTHQATVTDFGLGL